MNSKTSDSTPRPTPRFLLAGLLTSLFAVIGVIGAISYYMISLEPTTRSGAAAHHGTATSDADAMRDALVALHDPAAARVVDAAPSALAGFIESRVDGGVVYVSQDGRYVISGSVRDTRSGEDLTAKVLDAARAAAIAALDSRARIVFAPEHPRASVTVFTDLDCPFCRRFQEQVGELNRLGIAVTYLPFPLNIHADADRKAQAVWCAQDPPAAFQAAMAGIDPGTGTCPNLVAASRALAETLGLSGTPTVIAQDGSVVPPSIAFDTKAFAAKLGLSEID
ncbi:MAG: DsbC family protein [Dokdonella sp.]